MTDWCKIKNNILVRLGRAGSETTHAPGAVLHAIRLSIAFLLFSSLLQCPRQATKAIVAVAKRDGPRWLGINSIRLRSWRTMDDVCARAVFYCGAPIRAPVRLPPFFQRKRQGLAKLQTASRFEHLPPIDDRSVRGEESLLKPACSVSPH